MCDKAMPFICKYGLSDGLMLNQWAGNKVDWNTKSSF